ncbi:hypothetical protein [Streptomyces sp. NBC_01594]|uniref:hypothetical protein n=1 Tax=Streptomyces sp. NBC_01594 TaxID=2975890 RepID=UPI0038701856
MDEGSAAVIAAALGIAGTLFGSLGGAFVAARAARNQVRDQEGAEHRHWLRQERQKAYITFLGHAQQAIEILHATEKLQTSGGDPLDITLESSKQAISAARGALTAIVMTGPLKVQWKAAELVTGLKEYAKKLEEGDVDLLTSRRRCGDGERAYLIEASEVLGTDLPSQQ